MLSREIIILSRPGFELSYYHLATLKVMGGVKAYAARSLGTPDCSAVGCASCLVLTEGKRPDKVRLPTRNHPTTHSADVAYDTPDDPTAESTPQDIVGR